MTYTTDTSVGRIPFHTLLLLEIIAYCTAKCIVGTRVVANNGPKLSYDSIVLKDWKQCSKLLFSIMTTYCIESKQSFGKCFLSLINKISINSKKKKLV